MPAPRAARPPTQLKSLEELSQILKLTNREVLRAELTDAKHRSQRHRERARWLEGELLMAQNKAAGWRGATPSTEGDRVMFMQRELDFCS